MAYKNDEGKIVCQKKVIKKKIKIDKDPYNIGLTFSYVGRTKETGSTIVCYDGKILEKLDNDMFKVQFIDCNINKSKIPFIRTIPKSCIHLK